MIGQDCIGWVIECGPNGDISFTEDEVAGVVEGGGGDAEAGGVGLPNDGGGAVEEAEVAVGEELEGGGEVGGSGITAGYPDGDDVVEGDGGGVGGGAAVGDEAEREGVVWGGPSLVWVRGVEG